MPIGTWLLAMMQPLIARVLLALGFQVITITGMAVATSQLKAMFLQHLNSVANAGLQLALLAGVGEAFGIIFGAIAFKIALWQIQSATRILGVGGGAT
jgi:hypothetical protein